MTDSHRPGNFRKAVGQLFSYMMRYRGQMLRMLACAVAGTLFGHERVFIVAGTNKICPDFDAALKRARNTAAVQNAERLDKKTPCRIDGTCHDCHGREGICRALTVLWGPMNGMETEIVLIDGDWGL